MTMLSSVMHTLCLVILNQYLVSTVQFWPTACVEVQNRVRYRVKGTSFGFSSRVTATLPQCTRDSKQPLKQVKYKNLSWKRDFSRDCLRYFLELAFKRVLLLKCRCGTFSLSRGCKRDVSQRHISASADLSKTWSNLDNEFPHPFPLPSPPTPFRVDSEGGKSFPSHINPKCYVYGSYVFQRNEFE